ncbi:hypothetical protein FQR65_LT18014 [Abscondita terminalis]|nr:hypothetical protein FQR65_LT18014 [Abscondita terminalis]
MQEGKAVIAFSDDGLWAGFCYIETWTGEFVANSGLIVNPRYRKFGLARDIKHAIFSLSRKKYPEAKIFGLTTGLAVMKINSELGYWPKKVVLAYSGGLDTTYCALYLSKTLGYEVHAVTVNTGGFTAEEIQTIEQKALSLGIASYRCVDSVVDMYTSLV